MVPNQRGSATGPLVSLTAAVALNVSVFFTLYSLIPVTRPDSPELGSLFAGVLMIFVMGVQAFTPRLIRRFSLRGVVAGSSICLAAGALLTGLSDGVAVLLTGAAIGGSGFGVLIVAGAQGIALLASPARLGRALGIYGFTTMASSAVGAPAGLYLALEFSPAVFGMSAVAVGLVAVALCFRIPAAAGRNADVEADVEADTDAAHSAHTGSSESMSPVSEQSSNSRSDQVSAPRAHTPQKLLFEGVPWLVLGFLILGVLVFSHGLSSLPAMATVYGTATIVVFAVQSGNALGRWVGGEIESRISAAGVVLAGTALICVGVALGAAVDGPTAGVVSGALLGFGAGAVQTVTLHTAMQRIDAGRASVVWNITVDAGFWVGGILWGLALAHDFVSVGTIAVAAAVAVVAVLLVPQLRHQR